MIFVMDFSSEDIPNRGLVLLFVYLRHYTFREIKL